MPRSAIVTGIDRGRSEADHGAWRAGDGATLLGLWGEPGRVHMAVLDAERRRAC